MTNLKFSIVTASFNRADMIERAIHSVQQQDKSIDVEHIITDGASSDNTLEILKKYPDLVVHSEKDKGVYDAWNKGIAIATGDIIGILNSDDFYTKHTLNTVLRAFQESPDADIVRGETQSIDEKDDDQSILLKHTKISEGIRPLTLKSINIYGPKINGCFFRKSFIKKIGEFQLSQGLSADCGFMIKSALQRPKTVFIPQVFYVYRVHEGALTHNFGTKNWDKIRKEKLDITEFYLNDENTTESEKKILRKHHARKCVADSLHFILNGNFEGFKNCLQRGHKYNRIFVLDAFQGLCGIIGFRLREAYLKRTAFRH